MVFFVVLLGLGLRLISLNQSLWLDEATTALTTQMTLSGFFGKFLPGDFHPPLYYLIVRFWSLFFGTSEVTLRSLSVLLGIGTIYIVYLIGKKLLDKKTGIVASILLATSGLHIYYSQEARMYSMSTFFVSLTVLFFIEIFHKESGGRRWILFSILLGVIGLTDYLPLLILPVFWLMGIISKKNQNWWKKFIMSHIVLVVFALVWSPFFIKQLTAGVDITNTSPAWTAVLGKFSLKEILLIPVKFEIGRVTIVNKYLYVAVVGTIMLLFLFLYYKASKSFNRIKIIWFWLVIPIVISLVISFKIPVLNYFRFLFVIPAFYLILACGVKNKTILVIVVLINLITSFIYLTNVQFQREDWRRAVEFVSDSPVIFSGNSQKEAFLYYGPTTNIITIDNLENIEEFYLIRYAQPISDPYDLTRKEIESLGYNKTQEYDFNGVVVWKYNY